MTSQLPFSSALEVNRVMNEGKLDKAWTMMDSLLSTRNYWAPSEVVANYAMAGRLGNRTDRMDFAAAQFPVGEMALDSSATHPAAAVMLYDAWSEHFWFKGDPLQALEKMKRSESWLKKDTVLVDHARYHNNRAIISWNLGDYEDARFHLLEALERNVAIHGSSNRKVARNLNNLGVLYMERGELDVSQNYFSRALNMIESIDGSEHPDLLFPINNLGVIAGESKDLQRAQAWFERSWNLMEKIHSPAARFTEVMTFEAQAYLANGQKDAAMKLWWELQERYETASNRNLIPLAEVTLKIIENGGTSGISLSDLIDKLVANGLTQHPVYRHAMVLSAKQQLTANPYKAEELIDELIQRIDVSTQLPDVHLANAIAIKGVLEEDLQVKIQHFHRAAEFLDIERSTLLLEEARSLLYQSVHPTYQLMLDDLFDFMEASNDTVGTSTAIDLIESCKGYTDRWYVQQRIDNDTTLIRTKALIHYYRSLHERDPMDHPLSDTLIYLTNQLTSLQNKDPKAHVDIALYLDDGQVFLSYLKLGDQLFISRINKEGRKVVRRSVENYSLLISQAGNAINSKEKALGNAEERNEWRLIYKKLRALLWENIVTEKDAQLFISLDESLAGLRFNLFDLIEERTQVRNPILVPLAADLRRKEIERSKVQIWSSDYVDHPYLPALRYTQEETKAIARTFPTEIFSNEQLSISALASDFDTASWSHFALHSIPIRGNERGLVLPSPEGDELLRASDIYYHGFRPDHLTLSGCGTSQGKLLPGEGISSLVVPFLRNGTEAVVASGWNVDDLATSLFMEAYYQALDGGKTNIEALDIAQEKVRTYNGGVYQHPYFWSCWQVYGREIVVRKEASKTLFIGLLLGLFFAVIVYQTKK